MITKYHSHVLFSFTVDDPIIISLNQYRTLHWSKQTQVRDQQYLQIQHAFKSARLKNNKRKKVILNKYYPVDLEFILEKSRPYDCSNIVVKYWEDTLVLLKVLKDDSPKYVRSVTLRSKKASYNLLTICIRSTHFTV